MLAGNDERNIRFRRTLRDGDDVDLFAAQGAEGAPRHTHGAAHVFSDDRDDGNIRVERDVFDFVMRQILRELLAQRVDGALRVGRSHDEADVVLRRRL